MVFGFWGQERNNMKLGRRGDGKDLGGLGKGEI